MKRGTPDHPKVAALAEKINQPIYSAVGILELLWHFTADFAPRGNVGRFPDKSLCAAMKWGKSRINLINALVECGFIERNPEHRLIVHDWKDHADQAVIRKLERSGDEFITSHRLDEVKPATSLPEPEPEPVHRGQSLQKTPKEPSEYDRIATEVGAAIWARHPEQRRDISANAVTGKLKRIVAHKAWKGDERLIQLRAIDERHKGWCSSESWTREGCAFAKGLDNWLAPTMDRYMAEPPHDCGGLDFGGPHPAMIL